ncbi:MAG: TetR family transcriptional regulator [Pseudonocardiaceae bacterium]|nr:TetR family transcriptional regulator [Pseudonocardiaceae bacterium]
MSPKPADPAVRTELVEAAARVLADEGPRALTTRRLAAEVGTSTMAVYTYFGGMDEVRRAVRREGFARLAAHLDATPRSADPVADLVAAGAAYLTNGLANPHLYRAMFLERPPDDDAAVGIDTFQRLVDAVRRCIEAGRFHQVNPWGLAVQLWTMRHGMVSLALAGLLPAEQISRHIADMTMRLFVGYGDDPAAAQRSVDRALRDYQH